jgi:hypothetical protein
LVYGDQQIIIKTGRNKKLTANKKWMGIDYTSTIVTVVGLTLFFKKYHSLVFT